MTFSKIKAKETRQLTRTLEKTLEAKLACSDTAVIDNKILNNEIDKLEKELEQIYEQKAHRLDLGRNGQNLTKKTMLIFQAQKRNDKLKSRSQNYQMMRGI